MGSTEASRPLVSVVIPTYNRAEMLSITLKSVAGQTYHPIELIVVDDCSPEPVVAEPVDDLEVTVVRHALTMGPGAARNTGMAIATGTYLAFLDDDDQWDPEYLERAVRNLESGAGRMAAAETSRRLRRYEGDMRRTLHHHHLPSLGQVVMHRSDAVQFDPTLRLSEDIEWWARMQDCAVFAWDPDVRYLINEHQGERRGVDRLVRPRCRREVLRRHRSDLDREGRAWHLSRIAAAELEARRRGHAVTAAARSLATRPTSLALKLLVLSCMPGNRAATS